MSALTVNLALGRLVSLEGTLMTFSAWPRGMLPTCMVKPSSVFSPGASLSVFRAATVQPQEVVGFPSVSRA